MLTVQEAVKRYSKDPTKIQPLIPDFSHVRRNIVIGPPQYLTWDQVYIDDAQGNTARMVDATPGEKGGADAQHIADLEESFKEGWRQHEPLPAVQEHDLNLHKEGVFAPQKRYRLKYGFGRILALIGMGVKGWFFHVIKYEDGTDLTPDDWDGVTLSENEGLPKKLNKHANIIYVIKQQIARRTLDNTEEDIKARINQYLPNRKGQSKSKIAEAVMESSGTPQKYAFWTDTKIDLWVQNQLSIDIQKYVYGGKWDENREMWGYSSSIAGLPRTYGQAIRQYAQTGHKSYVILHFGNPSAKVPMMSKRLNGVQSYTSLCQEYAEVYGKHVEVLKIMGAMPQVHGVDKWDRLVELEIPKFKPMNKALSYVDDDVSPAIAYKIDEKLGIAA